MSDSWTLPLPLPRRGSSGGLPVLAPAPSCPVRASLARPHSYGWTIVPLLDGPAQSIPPALRLTCLLEEWTSTSHKEAIAGVACP